MQLADTCADTRAPFDPRSPRLVRLLILMGLGMGLLGLGATGGPAPSSSVAITTAAAVTPVAQAGRIPTEDVRVRHASRSAARRTVAPRTVAPRPRRHTVRRPSWVRPSSAAVVSRYGMRWGRMHKGIDFGAHYGAPIRAIGDGVVVGAGYLSGEGGYGQITIIRHSRGVYSAYAHQSRTAVHAGERVKAGEVIGYVGSTGHSTGPHLHFEIRHSAHGGQVNPLTWLRAMHVPV